MRRGVVVEIDLDAAAHNLKSVAQAVGGLPVIAVVKADAYGHGAREMARTFQKHGATHLAVAFLSEALDLREAGISTPIIVLFDATETAPYFEHNLIPVIHTTKAAERLSKEASRRNQTLDLHIKVDTGMGRMGLIDAQEIKKIASLPGLNITGLMSHLSDAELSDHEFATHQLDKFLAVRHMCESLGLHPLCHIANSAATLSMTDFHLDAVRPGLALYGVSPFNDNQAQAHVTLKPVMTVKARITAIKRFPAGHPVSYGRTFVTARETLGAVLAVGYADGYSRALSNNAEVLIKGNRAPVIGRVCMDLMVVDITGIEDVSEDDEVILMGSSMDEHITAWELGSRAGTISYEILTSFGCANPNRVLISAESRE